MERGGQTSHCERLARNAMEEGETKVAVEAAITLESSSRRFNFWNLHLLVSNNLSRFFSHIQNENNRVPGF